MRRRRRGRSPGDDTGEFSSAMESNPKARPTASKILRSTSTQGELLLSNCSRFDGSICARRGHCLAEFTTCTGEVLYGKWLFRCLFFDKFHASPIAAYDVKLHIDSRNKKTSRSCSPTKKPSSAANGYFPNSLPMETHRNGGHKPSPPGRTESDSGTKFYRGEALLVLKSGELVLTEDPTLLDSGSRNSRSSSGNHTDPPEHKDEVKRPVYYRTASLTRQTSEKSFEQFCRNPFGLSQDESTLITSALISPVRSRSEKYESDHDSSIMFWSVFGQATVRSRWDDEILKDVARTSFALWPKGKIRQDAHNQLYDILRFVAQAFPQIGYCQGMHCVAKYLLTFYGAEDGAETECSSLQRLSSSTILWRSGSSNSGMTSSGRLSELESEVTLRSASPTASTFILFAELLKSPDYRLADLFSPGFSLLKSLLSELDCRLEKVEPVLFAHLEETHVHSLLYATKWFLTVFTFYVELDRDAVTNVWLRFLSQGWDSVIDIAVACVSGVKELLLNADLDACLEVLSGRSSYTKDGLLANVFGTQRGQACLLQASKFDKGAEFYRQPSPLPFTQSNAKPSRFVRRHSFS